MRVPWSSKDGAIESMVARRVIFQMARCYGFNTPASNRAIGRRVDGPSAKMMGTLDTRALPVFLDGYDRIRIRARRRFAHSGRSTGALPGARLIQLRLSP